MYFNLIYKRVKLKKDCLGLKDKSSSYNYNNIDNDIDYDLITKSLF